MNLTQPHAYLDSETTSLVPTIYPDGRRAWEFSAIRVTPGREGELPHEHVLGVHVEVDLTHANPTALELGGFYERSPFAPTHNNLMRRIDHREFQAPEWADEYVVITKQMYGTDEGRRAAGVLWRQLAGAVIVGSNPAFDTANAEALFADVGLPITPEWEYKLYDIAAHGTGVLALPGTGPRTSVLSEKFGIERPPFPHEAYGDARWAQQMHEAIEAHKEMP